MRQVGSRRADFPAAFGARVLVLEALVGAGAGEVTADQLGEAAERLSEEAQELAGAASVHYWAYAALAQSGAMLLRWAKAVREADANADTYLRAAKQLVADLQRDLNMEELGEPLAAVALQVLEMEEVGEVKEVLAATLRVALPLPGEKRKAVATGLVSERRSPQEEVESVAVVAFQLDGERIDGVATVEPRVNHELQVSLELSRWHESAEELVLDALTTHDPGACRFPTFVFRRDEDHVAGKPMVQADFLRLDVPQTIASRPLEVRYRACFREGREEYPIAVEGERQFELRGYSARLSPVTGYEELDQELVSLRDDLRRSGGISESKIGDFLEVMVSLSAMAARALHDAEFTGDWNERRFQKYVTRELRRNPRIGSALEAHPHASGGITDLSLRGLRIELKVVRKGTVSAASADRYAGQASQYVAGSDSRVGVICILDMAPKAEPSHSVVNDVGLCRKKPANGDGLPILLGVVVVRGNLPNPSSLSP